MNIFFVHNSYQHLGGEDSVLESELNLLSKNGHNVSLALKENDGINSFWEKASAFFNVTYSKQSKQWMSEQIIRHKPDVVHVHNFFPLLSPSIYDACIEAGVPVVQTLHNYRTICPTALLMFRGKVCERSLHEPAYWAVRHKVYKNSFAGTFALARMIEYHKRKKTWQHKVDCFIALTEFGKAKFIEAGFPAHKIVVKPNFSDAGSLIEDDSSPERKGALFVGRLSEEKGIKTLIAAWKNLEISLHIAGSGPLEKLFFELPNSSIKSLGMLDKESVKQEMQQAAFLVMPSEWYEGFPMVLVEAFSQGLPVVASKLGGMAEIIEDGVTGLHFEAGNASDLADKVRWMNEHPEESRQMGRNARKEYEQKYIPEKNYGMLMDIYQQVIDSSESPK